MFAAVTKFKLINANIPDICLTQLTIFQNYLRTIHKRNEIDDILFTVKLSHSLLARAHGLPKTHKAFDSLPPFRPIIDTTGTGTAYEFFAKHSSKLLFFPLTLKSEFKLKDSFDAVNRIYIVPLHLFSDGYRFLFIELSGISKFTSWNVFPKLLTENLLKHFAPKATNNLTNNTTDLLTNNIAHLNELDNIPQNWIPLPFIGKRGTTLLNNCTKKLRRLIKQPVKFATLWNTTTTNAFLGVKNIRHVVKRGLDWTCKTLTGLKFVKRGLDSNL